MFYDFGLGGVGQYNAPGLTQVPAPTPAPSLAPFPLPPALARPPAPMQSTNPYEMEQVRLMNEQRGLVDQSRQITPPQINYTPPMNPLAAALIAFGSGTLAHGGSGLTSLGAGGKAGLETYLGLKNQDQEKTNQVSQANYANQMNQLKAVMGGLGEISKGYGELSKDQAERAKAAALIGADVYSNQIKQDYYNAQNAMEAGKLPFLTNLYSAQANNYNFNADPNNPYNKQAVAAAKLAGVEERNAIARQKMEGEYGQQLSATLAKARQLTDDEIELEAFRLAQINPATQNPLADPSQVRLDIRNGLLNARKIARGENPTAPGLIPEPGKPKTKPNTNPVSQYLTLP